MGILVTPTFILHYILKNRFFTPVFDGNLFELLMYDQFKQLRAPKNNTYIHAFIFRYRYQIRMQILSSLFIHSYFTFT